MTENEVNEFNKAIEKTIIPYIKHLSDDKIETMVYDIEEKNPEVPKGFGNMLFRQIMKVKYGNYQK